MIPEPFVAAAGATSAEVALLMRAKDISVVPVVDNPKDRRYLGTISDRDIVTQCVAAGHDPKECSAQVHARRDTVVVTPETELIDDRRSRREQASGGVYSASGVHTGNSHSQDVEKAKARRTDA